MPLLPSKLIPPQLSHAAVVRQRLVGLVSAGVSRTPVTLVSGPAGSGKTVLAASWLRMQPNPEGIAWLSLDEADDDPATFWAYVVEALAGAGVDLTGLVRPPAGEPVAAAFTSTLAARLLAGGRTVVLVLDNADCLTKAEVCHALDLLVRHAGERLRLVLCARADPQLPLHQYRVADVLTEIRRETLAFTPEEARELLNRLGVPVPAEVAADLQARTEGWAVGLRLAAAPLKQGVPPAQLVDSLADTDGSVAQYLFAEVLADQPAPVRRFLLRVSVTAELWPDLVEKLSPRSNGRRILASLARINAFVEQSVAAPGGYRIHPLFREMLKAQLQYDHPQDVAGLHRTCAVWYAAAGRRPAAMAHAIQAGDWPLAVRLAVDDLLVAAILVHEADPCLRFLDGMPPDLAGPEAAAIRLAAALPRRCPVARADLQLARAAAADGGSRPALRVSAAVAAVCVGAREGAPSTQLLAEAEAAERLLTDLPEDRPTQRREFAAAIKVARAFALLSSDAPDGPLVAALRSSLAAATSAHSSRLRSRMLGQLALVVALRGELRHAAELAEEAAAVAGERGTTRTERYPAAAAASAWVAMERYDHAGARHWIGRVQEAAADAESPWVAPVLAVLQSRLLRLRHEFASAEHVLRPHLEDRSSPRWIRTHVLAEGARIHLAAGDVEGALRVIDGGGDDGPSSAVLRGTAMVLSGRPPALPGDVGDLAPAAAVEVQILRACAQLQAGAVQAARTAIQGALRAAEPEGLRRPFFDSPADVRRLLRGQPQLALAASWLNPSTTEARVRRGTQQAQAAAPAPPEVLQPLSDRELEVLRHLAELLSTAEIAAAMFVSINTVRTHIRSILRKLSVSRRNQAVRRGRELGLV